MNPEPFGFRHFDKAQGPEVDSKGSGPEPGERHFRSTGAGVNAPALSRWAFFTLAWWFILRRCVEDSRDWRAFVAAILGVVTLWFWDSWRGKREDREMRRRFEARDES